MTVVLIRLTMVTDDVNKFVAIVNHYQYDIDLRS